MVKLLKDIYNIYCINKNILMLTIFLFGALIGMAIGVLSNYNLIHYIITGVKEIKHYVEDHLIELNICVHILCMPFTIYGILFSI